jgi:acetylornithine deacetylase/succinyl-diaminopimelate desuccinylase-like protein
VTDTVVADTVVADTVELLRRLVAVDTSNPPGNETAAAEVLRAFLEPAGVQCELVAREATRANLVARLPGGDGPTLCFLGHLDVVPARVLEWSRPPFAGALENGRVWGRGTVDMKCQLAAVATALCRVARDGRRPPGDILLLAVADEEVGEAQVGMPWLVEARPDIRTDYVIGEGAGERYNGDDGSFYTLDHGAKASCSPVRVTARGRSGDASLPGATPNALDELARLLIRLPKGPPREPRALLRHALAGSTFVPVRVETPEESNVVPHEATCELYASVQPDATVASIEQELRELLGNDADYEIDVPEPQGGSTSPLQTPLHGAVEAFIGAHDGEARLEPILGYGYSDCHLAREAWDAIAYGFIPFRYVDPLVNLTTKHGADEHVLIDDLAFQTDCAQWLALADLS